MLATTHMYEPKTCFEHALSWNHCHFFSAIENISIIAGFEVARCCCSITSCPANTNRSETTGGQTPHSSFVPIR